MVVFASVVENKMVACLSTLLCWSGDECESLRDFVERFQEKLPVVIQITSGYMAGDGHITYEVGAEEVSGTTAW